MSRTEPTTVDRTTDRAVSEVISFALIFSLIAATVALVYVAGIGGLEDTRSSERISNAERAYDVLADNIADIHRQGAPSRATEIKVSNAQMEYGEEVRTTVRIENLWTRNASNNNISTSVIQPIVYSSSSGTELVYANGAVFREDRGGVLFNREPSFLFVSDGSERTAIVPIIQTRAQGPASTGSQRTILVRTLLANREAVIAEDDPGKLTPDPDNDGTSEFSSGDLDPDSDGDDEFAVTLRVTTTEERRDVWLDYLNGAIPDDQDVRGTIGDGVACETVSPTEIECSLAVEKVYSAATRIDVTYD